MRGKLCSRCAYMPRDLASHCDLKGVLHVWAKCDGNKTRRAPTTTHVRPRGGKDAQQPRMFLEWRDQALRDLRRKFGLIRYYSWRTALCSKNCADRFTANGYADFNPPDNGCGEPSEATSHIADHLDGTNDLCAPPPNGLHLIDTVFCFASGGST
jgi:hypothetical protein